MPAFRMYFGFFIVPLFYNEFSRLRKSGEMQIFPFVFVITQQTHGLFQLEDYLYFGLSDWLAMVTMMFPKNPNLFYNGIMFCLIRMNLAPL